MTIFNSRKLLAALAIGLLAVSGVVACTGTAGDFGAGATEDEAVETTEEAAENDWESTVPVKKSHSPQGKSVIAKNDERQIVGYSSDVFFGRVVKQSGSEGAPVTGPGPDQPMTQYAVEVTENIKGDASGTVTVNQIGGYIDDGHADHKHLDLFEGDALLEPGQEYLFATNYVPEEDWYQIVLGDAGNVEAKDRAQRKELKDKFEKARANQLEPKIPSKNPSPEEREKRSYKPCRPDGSNPYSEFSCDPSDPLPPGKSKYSSGEPG